MADVAKKRGTWGGARPGTGPKPKPDEQVRKRGLLVRMTPAEWAAIEAAAAGLPLATWVRSVALRAARRKGTR